MTFKEIAKLDELLEVGCLKKICTYNYDNTFISYELDTNIYIEYKNSFNPIKNAKIIDLALELESEIKEKIAELNQDLKALSGFIVNKKNQTNIEKAIKIKEKNK